MYTREIAHKFGGNANTKHTNTHAYSFRSNVLLKRAWCLHDNNNIIVVADGD